MRYGLEKNPDKAESHYDLLLWNPAVEKGGSLGSPWVSVAPLAAQNQNEQA